PSESDELRKAISKKKKEDIDKHRAKFVKGAVEKGMDQSTADAIYMDWEEFARYGFNKSHAADYGVIAVQTAYLKSTYTAEYMTALLSANAGITEKVAFYVADARNMGVPVLQPDVASSGWDFEIEDVDGKPSIRFGLGAIKNVNQGAVEAIIEARKESKFIDLNDFARRVDLRTVGKRSLECLIKVGALDQFGNRPAMLASLDRIIAISANHFRAADAGQMSLFGAATGIIEEIHLPEVKNVDKREMLNWERELIGLYITDHPLNEYQATLAQIVSYFSAQLTEASHEEKVRVAGLVTIVRPYTTKTGKAMGFVTIEDIQGNIELVLFPKTWDKHRDVLTVGQIVIVEGKVDNSNPPPKILVDVIKTEIKVTSAAEEIIPETPPAPPKPLHYKSTTAPAQKATQQPTQNPPKPVAAVSQPVNTPHVVAEATPDYSADLDGMPPPPDNFPDGWDTEWQPSFDEAAIAAKPAPKFKKDEPITPPRAAAVSAPVEIIDKEQNQAEAPHEALTFTHMPSLYVPLAKEEADHPPKQITVILRASEDRERDKRRIKTLHGTLISFHGRDKFSFQIFENGKGHLIDFPSETTRISPELFTRLHKLLGEENWHVEEITFQ
ncbi:MAG TPA: OB-fold nucleic acid binding domain-containing protein, partial [Anaerolineales bacterium]|nr:OB-fold nucleic acid binding domain-containing protein [Anaerolineales bacterium]